MYFYEDWLLDLMRSDSQFLRRMGIKPCAINDPCPEPPPVPFARDFKEFIRLCDMTHIRAKERRVRLTEKDDLWLKASGVAWEPEPALQLSMDFCAHQEGRVGDLDF
jgi:hypothetical protein